MSMEQEDVTVTAVDDVSDVAHEHDRLRKLGEYKPTNMPLSKFEIEQDEAKDTEHKGWAPRTAQNIGDLTPLPEKPGPPDDID
jgi:hypothetical protein